MTVAVEWQFQNGIALYLTREQALRASSPLTDYPGLMSVIAELEPQLKPLKNAQLAGALEPYGFMSHELAHAGRHTNMRRLVWMAACGVKELTEPGMVQA
jgi:hypothetical protein